MIFVGVPLIYGLILLAPLPLLAFGLISDKPARAPNRAQARMCATGAPKALGAGAFGAGAARMRRSSAPRLRHLLGAPAPWCAACAESSRRRTRSRFDTSPPRSAQPAPKSPAAPRQISHVLPPPRRAYCNGGKSHLPRACPAQPNTPLPWNPA